jgi:hypothetical protein
MYAELIVQGLGIVADNVKAAAFGWSLRAKRADNYVTSWLYSPGDLADVGNAIACGGKEMEHRPVMPHMVGGWLQFASRDVRNQPVDGLCEVPEALAVGIDRGLRDIEDADVPVPPGQQIVN